MEKLEEVVDLLRRKGYKLTPQRLEVIKALINLSGSHPTLDVLLKNVKKNVPTMSISTLYSTVLKLQELGVIKTVFIQGKIRVESNLKPHVNIVDPKTGKIEDILDEEIVKRIKSILKEKGYPSKNFIANIILS